MNKAALLFALGLFAASPAFAQTINMGGGGSSQPIEITARDGIEWDRDNMRYVARGAARVTQADRTIEADTLTAFYRVAATGGTEIYRYTAAGNVRISNAAQRAVADAGVYDVDSGVVTLTGKAMKITTAAQEITARDSLEYWETKDMAVARGNALVVSSDGRRIGADMLAAHFTQPARPQSRTAAARQRPAAAPQGPQAAGAPPNRPPPPRWPPFAASLSSLRSFHIAFSATQAPASARQTPRAISGRRRSINPVIATP